MPRVRSAPSSRHSIQENELKLTCKPLDASKSAYVDSFPDKNGAKSKPQDDRPPIKRGKYEGLSRRQTRRKLAIEADEADAKESGNRVGPKHTEAAIRNAKKANRPVKITEALPKKSLSKGKDKKASRKKKSGRVGGGRGSAFDTPGSGGATEGMRAQKTKVNLNKKGDKKAVKGKPRPKK